MGLATAKQAGKQGAEMIVNFFEGLIEPLAALAVEPADALAQAGEAPILTFAVRRGAAIGMWAGIVGAWRAADTGKP